MTQQLYIVYLQGEQLALRIYLDAVANDRLTWRIPGIPMPSGAEGMSQPALAPSYPKQRRPDPPHRLSGTSHMHHMVHTVSMAAPQPPCRASHIGAGLLSLKAPVTALTLANASLFQADPKSVQDRTLIQLGWAHCRLACCHTQAPPSQLMKKSQA